jgi:drug/metabolite transporter (DMT)-like permease
VAGLQGGARPRRAVADRRVAGLTRRDSALLLVLGATWGAVYPLTTIALRELSPPAVVFYRAALAAVVLLPVALRAGVLRAAAARPLAVLGAALLQATIPLVLLTTGQQHVSAALAGIVLATQALWAAVLTAAASGGLRARTLAGILTGLCGVIALFAADLRLDGSTGLGGLELLAAAACYAAGSVYIERVIPEVPPVATAAAAMTVSAIALVPFAAATGLAIPGLATAVWVVVLGVVGTGAALAGFYLLIQRAGAVRANLAGYLAPAFAVLYGLTFLGEHLHPGAIAGLALILAGSYLAVA